MKKTLAVLLVICLMFTSLFAIPVFAEEGTTFLMTELEGKYKTQGRTVFNNDGILLAHYPATGIEFNAYCEGDVSVTFNVTNLGYKTGIGGCYFTVIVDGEIMPRETCHINETGDVTVKIAEGLAEGNHTFKLFRQNEITYGYLGFKSITLDGEILDAPEDKDMYIEVVGDSETGGWGNLGDDTTPDTDLAEFQDATQAYAYVAAQELDADWSVISVAGIGAYWGGQTMSLIYDYVGYFNDKNTLYDFENSRKPDYVVIGLGTNDFNKVAANGKTHDDLYDAFNDFLRLIRSKNPGAKIVWAHGMMNDNATHYIQSAIEAVGGADYGVYDVHVTANTDGATAHASVEGQKVMGEEIAARIKEIEAENKSFISEFPPKASDDTEENEGSEGKKSIVLESNFESDSKWTARGSAKLIDEDGDGIKEVARLTSSSTANIALRSPSFTLIPGDEYELTFYVRVPDTSGDFYTDTLNYYPRYAFFQPTTTEDGVAVTDNYTLNSNDYAYKTFAELISLALGK